ncbi:MAG: hypothetical protein AAF846_19085 [Chloroflexota bacterium]
MSEQPKPKKDKRFSDGSRPMIYTESLMEIFGFDATALRSNDGGFVTNAQKQNIQEELKSEADSMWLLATIFLGTAVLLALIFTFQGYPVMPLVIGVGGLTAAVFGIGYFRQSRLAKDTDRLRAVSVEGVPIIRNTLSARDRQATLEIGGQKLPITYEEAMALSEFELPVMRIYYAANSKQILSAEVLHSPDVEKLKNDNLLDEDDLVYSGRQLDDEQTMRR